MRRSFVIILVLILLALTATACGFNLAADITPPPGWHPTAAPPTPNTANLYPAIPPDPVIGEQIYQQECEQCHGPRAMGDGPKAAELGITPAALASAEEVQEDAPIKRFLVLTHGKEEDGMPPFAGKLTERQRWDVLAYVYTLSVSPQKLEKGKSLYAQRCVACHGIDGKGKNLTDQKRMANLSDEEIANAITGKQHPTDVYSGLSKEDRLVLASYIRVLSFARQEALGAEAEQSPNATPTASGTQPAPKQTPSGTPAGATITITGTVTNGTANAKVPPGIEVELQGYDDAASNPNKVVDLKTKADENGKFRFENVPNSPSRLFFVSTTYEGVTYGSHAIVRQHDTSTLDLPLVIYESTTDKSALKIERLHFFIEPAGENAYQIIEMYLIANNGDKTVVAEKKGEPVLSFELPAGATHLQFQSGNFKNRYIQTDGGFGDTAPIYAQSQMQEVFGYILPAEGKTVKISHSFPLPVDSAVLMAPEGEVNIRGDLLQDNGVQRDEQGNNYHIYITPPIKQGESLQFSLSRAKKGLKMPTGARRNLALGLVALGLALIVAAVVLTRRNRLAAVEEAPSAEYEDPEMLMDAILALDDLYKQGKLDEEAYHKRRAELKARLKALLDVGEEQAE